MMMLREIEVVLLSGKLHLPQRRERVKNLELFLLHIFTNFQPFAVNKFKVPVQYL